MRRTTLVVILVALGITVAGCGRGKRVVLEEARPGRDRELLEQGMTEFEKGRYAVGRFLLQTLINTYPDSPFVPIAKLAIGDSFYLEGTSEALAQAEVEYLDFANFFPNHPLADDALLQVAHIKMRRIQPPDRDQKPTREAERRLLNVLQRYPNTDLKDTIQQDLKAVREILSDHEMYVARQYMIRQRLKGAKGRLLTVVQKYPTYTKYDEALYRLGMVLFEEEEPEEAAKYFAWLVREYPTSEYRKSAADMLEKIGKPIPESVASDIAQTDGEAKKDKGLLGTLFTPLKTLFGAVGLDVPKEGVLVKRGETAEQLIVSATAYSKPSTVVTPTATTVTVGPASRTTPAGAAQGKQEITIGAQGETSGSPAKTPASADKDKKKKPEEKKKK